MVPLWMRDYHPVEALLIDSVVNRPQDEKETLVSGKLLALMDGTVTLSARPVVRGDSDREAPFDTNTAAERRQ